MARALVAVIVELAWTTWRAGGAIAPKWRRGAYALGATTLGLLLIGLKVATH